MGVTARPEHDEQPKMEKMSGLRSRTAVQDHHNDLRCVWGLITGQKRWLSMFEVLIGVLLGMLCIANVALWFKLSSCYDALTQIISRSKDFELDMPSLDGIRDEINDTLTDFVSNLHVPNAGDHLISAAANGLNMFFHRKFGAHIPVLAEQVIQQQNNPDNENIG